MEKCINVFVYILFYLLLNVCFIKYKITVCNVVEFKNRMTSKTLEGPSARFGDLASHTFAFPSKGVLVRYVTDMVWDFVTLGNPVFPLLRLARHSRIRSRGCVRNFLPSETKKWYPHTEFRSTFQIFRCLDCLPWSSNVWSVNCEIGCTTDFTLSYMRE